MARDGDTVLLTRDTTRDTPVLLYYPTFSIQQSDNHDTRSVLCQLGRFVPVWCFACVLFRSVLSKHTAIERLHQRYPAKGRFLSARTRKSCLGTRLSTFPTSLTSNARGLKEHVVAGRAIFHDHAGGSCWTTWNDRMELFTRSSSVCQPLSPARVQIRDQNDPPRPCRRIHQLEPKSKPCEALTLETEGYSSTSIGAWVRLQVTGLRWQQSIGHLRTPTLPSRSACGQVDACLVCVC